MSLADFWVSMRTRSLEGITLKLQECVGHDAEKGMQFKMSLHVLPSFVVEPTLGVKNVRW